MKLISRALTLVLVAVVAVLATSFAVASPGASADQPTSAAEAPTTASRTAARSNEDLKLCADDKYKGYCILRLSYDSDFNNDKYCAPFKTTKYQEGWGCGNFSSKYRFEDKTSSVKNYSHNWWKLYEDRQYKGYVMCLRPLGYDDNLGNNTPQEDDISSVKEFTPTKPTGCDQTIG